MTSSPVLLLVMFTALLASQGCGVDYGGPSGDASGTSLGSGSDDDDSAASADDDDTTMLSDDDDTTMLSDDDDTTMLSDDDDTTAVSDDDDSWAEIVLPPASCPCSFGQICDAGVCVYSDTLAVGLREVSENGGSPMGTGSACFWTTDYMGSIVGRDDDCEVRRLDGDSPPQTYYNADPGSVTITGGVMDPIHFSGGSPQSCLANNFSPGLLDLFDAGTSLHFESTGGPDVVAFSADLVAPEPIVGSPNAIVPGTALTMAWSASWSDYVELVVATEDLNTQDVFALICRAPDTGGFVIPAAMTDLLPDNHTPFTVSFARNVVEHIELGSQGVVVELALQTSWTDETN